MNIGGALGFVGQKTLNHYQWGQSVVNIVNSHLNDDYVTVYNSGTEITEIVLTLPNDVKNKILMIDIGPINGSISIDEHNNNKATLFLLLGTGGLAAIGLISIYLFLLMTNITVLKTDGEEVRTFLEHIEEIFSYILAVWQE